MTRPADEWQAAGVSPARRAFLAAFLGHDAGEPAGHAGRIPAERIALLKEIALRWERRLPEGAIPELRAGEACAGHGVCASVCPTGALRRFEEPGLAGLEFSAGCCFACGACIVVCPEKALDLTARGTGTAAASPERITHHALRACARCDDEFTARGADELCPACRKDVALFRSGFRSTSQER
jgi:ferredoxin